MDKLHAKLISAGIPVQSGIYCNDDGIFCHAALTPEQQAQFDAICAEWLATEQERTLIDQMSAAVEAHIDAVAHERDYTDGARCVSYANSTVLAWATEAQAFSAWRDNVWMTALEIMQECKQGIRQSPASDAELIAELPVMVWP